jgi:hypothetical protein
MPLFERLSVFKMNDVQRHVGWEGKGIECKEIAFGLSPFSEVYVLFVQDLVPALQIFPKSTV